MADSIGPDSTGPFRKALQGLRRRSEGAGEAVGADRGSPHGGASPAAARDDERGRAASLAHRLGSGARSGLATIVDRLVAAAPRIPVRDLQTLRRQFPGLDAEEIADRLIAAAATGTTVVGAGVGAAAMLPVPPAMATELATELLAVAVVEYKLIAELHEVYGVPATGTARQRAAAYLGAWAEQRGIDVVRPSTVGTALSGPLKRQLRQRLARRSVRHLPNLAPFMIGAGVGAVLNRRDTGRLADRVRADLRARRRPWPEHPAIGRPRPELDAAGRPSPEPPAIEPS